MAPNPQLAHSGILLVSNLAGLPYKSDRTQQLLSEGATLPVVAGTATVAETVIKTVDRVRQFSQSLVSPQNPAPSSSFLPTLGPAAKYLGPAGTTALVLHYINTGNYPKAAGVTAGLSAGYAVGTSCAEGTAPFFTTVPGAVGATVFCLGAGIFASYAMSNAAERATQYALSNNSEKSQDLRLPPKPSHSETVKKIAPIQPPKVQVMRYAVPFDSNKSTLTPEAKQIIESAARDFTNGKCKNLFIDVNGRTDKSGSATYNQKLSERRAFAVAKELDRITSLLYNEMATRGSGKIDIPDKAPPGRRVEITGECTK